MAIEDDLDSLLDDLTVTCPMCGGIGTYQKDEIQTLVVHRKQ
jgi:hypothetical protein